MGDPQVCICPSDSRTEGRWPGSCGAGRRRLAGLSQNMLSRGSAQKRRVFRHWVTKANDQIGHVSI